MKNSVNFIFLLKSKINQKLIFSSSHSQHTSSETIYTLSSTLTPHNSQNIQFSKFPIQAAKNKKKTKLQTLAKSMCHSRLLFQHTQAIPCSFQIHTNNQHNSQNTQILQNSHSKETNQNSRLFQNSLCHSRLLFQQILGNSMLLIPKFK